MYRYPLRRVGLSRKDYSGGAPVTVNSSRNSSTANLPVADFKKSARITVETEKECIYGSPRNQSDSDDTDHGGIKREVGSSDDNTSSHGDIPSSSFARRCASSHESLRLTKRRLRSQEQEEEPIRKQRVLTTSSQAEYGSSVTGRTRGAANSSAGGSTETSSSPFASSAETDVFGNFIIKKRNATKKGYSRPSGKAAPSASAPAKTARKTIFVPPPEVPSDPAEPSTPKSFKARNYSDLVISPNDNAAFKTTQDIVGLSEESPPSFVPRFKVPEAVTDSLSPRISSPKFEMPVTTNSSSGEDDKQLTGHIDLAAELENSSQAAFRVPTIVQGLVRDLSPQSKGFSQAAFFDFDHDEMPLPSSECPQARCPMCNDAVDREFLEGYHIGRMNIRTQARFCRDHKKKSGKEIWTSRGYPEIHWDHLDSRIATHHRYLRSLLDGEPSYYRGILEESVKAGTNRNLKQAMMTSGDSITPGYYGSKGQRVMSENIMKKFSPALRKIAVTDRLVSARGVTGYVQSVLVPELAMILIQEDMKVDAEDARGIMKESITLGDLVNEEAEDVLERLLGNEEL